MGEGVEKPHAIWFLGTRYVRCSCGWFDHVKAEDFVGPRMSYDTLLDAHTEHKNGMRKVGK
jgi:hypothetical protein